MLSKCDRDQYMKFRDGEISLSQFVRGIEERRTGRTYKVLDDIKDDFPESLKNNEISARQTAFLIQAYKERQQDLECMKRAEKLGMDMKAFKDNMKNYNLPERCANSVFGKYDSIK